MADGLCHLASDVGMIVEPDTIRRATKSRRLADIMQQTQFVFGKAATGIANGTDDCSADVIASANVVEHAVVLVLFQRIEQHAIYGEVAALHIFGGRLGKTDFVGMATV